LFVVYFKLDEKYPQQMKKFLLFLLSLWLYSLIYWYEI
jgi:hypothetical protein